ncbi:hypothetical protein CSIRO_3762 [Bradyrhizobiaceae bacterium SG-6C]|nr:hypothetical protein CSIRO_3762 [Bradyrhizobiaceae bacterium SG-6C]
MRHVLSPSNLTRIYARFAGQSPRNKRLGPNWLRSLTDLLTRGGICCPPRLCCLGKVRQPRRNVVPELQ